jgi:lambda family phage portal protein
MGLFGFFFGKRINTRAQKLTEAAVSDQVNKIKRQCGYTRGYGTGYFADGSGSGGAKWPYGLSADGSGFTIDHYRTRLNARRAYHDSTQAKAVVDRLADTIADFGLVLESAPKAEILGITEEAAEIWASDVESRFDSWARDKKQHRAEQFNWYQSHRLNSIFQQRDGEVFQRLYYSPDKKLQNPLQFSFIDPNQIYSDSFTSTIGVNYFSDGIERDSRGRSISYTVWVQDPKKPGYFKKVKLLVSGPKSNKKFVLHAFAPEYPGQTRGYSRLAHALQEFENITDFSAAQVKKAINQSQLVMYVKPSPDNPASQPFEGILGGAGAGPAAAAYGADPSPPAEAENVGTVPPVSCYRLPEATFDTPGSAVVANLEEGEDIKPGPNNAPAESYNQFVDAFTAYIAASMSTPLEVVLMRFNQNYSASRAALILFWRVARIWQEEMAADILNPTFEAWMAGEIAAGRVSAPGWSDPVLRAAWLNSRWIGAPMPNIDPKRTADADKTYVELGAQTLDRVARGLNGSDGKTNRAKLHREFTELPDVPWVKNQPVGKTEDDEGGDEI